MTFTPKASPAARVKALEKFVADLRADSRPIILGPWRSELGFETLYWMPFLKWLAKQVPQFDQRAIVITRGGLAPLYAPVAAQGIDLYAMRDVTAVRRANLADQRDTGLQKQTRVTEWDDDVIAEAAKAHGLSLPYHVVHPAWMYWVCAPFWDEQAGIRHLLAVTDYNLLARPQLTIQGLPDRYTVVKWYARATFPYPHPEVAEFVQQVTATLAAQTPVVVLQSSPEHDDHADIHVVGPNVHHLQPMPAHENLIAQAAVIAKATAFVGTYGGVAQFALRMGIPSVSFWAEFGGTSHQHLSLSSWLSKQTKVPFLAGSMADANVWRQVTSAPMRQEVAA